MVGWVEAMRYPTKRENVGFRSSNALTGDARVRATAALTLERLIGKAEADIAENRVRDIDEILNNY